MRPNKKASGWINCLCVNVTLLLAFLLINPANAKPPTTAASPHVPDVTKNRIQATFLTAPLHFEANRGQTDGRVKFLARGSGYTLFLTSTEFVLALRKPDDKQSAISRQLSAQSKPTDSKLETPNSKLETVVRMKLVGANSDTKVAGLEQLPGKVNYFIGNDPKKWRTNIPTYKRLEYKDVYPGINLVFYGNQRQLEYDFVVSPGADPSVIQLAFEGADKIKVDTRGDLILQTALGDLRLHKPLVYQEIAGVRREISGSYVDLGFRDEVSTLKTQHSKLKTRNHFVGFQVAAYDTNRPLIIDPVLSYSTYLGGSGLDRGKAIAADASGNAYVTGLTSSTNFPTVNPYQDNFAGGSTPDAFGDAFVTKLDPTGSVVYSTYLGGRDNEDASGIAVDASGNSYVTGSTTSTNFPTTVGAFQPTKSGPKDVFVTKLNSQGNALVYSTYLGGSKSEDGGFGIAVDCSANAYVIGYTNSTDFPTKNAFQPQHGGGPQDDFRDAFVTKLSPDGNSLVYSTYLGASGVDVAWGVAADCSGNAYVTGETWSSNFPTTAGAFQTAFGGGIGDAFVTKLSPAGSVVYSTYVGGSGYEGGIGIAVDFNGNVYVTGSTPSPDFPTTAGSFQTVLRGTNDVFVVKLNPQGNALVYSTYVGGSGFEAGRGIAVDSSGAAYVAGITNSTDFPTRNPIQATNGGGVDTFVMKLNPSGNALVYSTYLGGSGGYEPEAKIGLDSCGNAYVAGITDSTDFPTANPFQAAFGGFNDAFVAKIGTDANTFFHDDFNRPDSAMVGNGWLDSPNNSVGNLSILSGQLTAVGVGANVAGIYRPFSFATPVSVSATVAESSGYGGLPRSYTAIFEIRSNGAWTSGYWLDFVRSDSNYNDSLIQLGDGANVIARFYPSIQFGPVLNLNFTFNVDGSVVGTVAQNGQTESFSFSPHAIQSTGDHFLVALSGPDGRATTNPIYHRLDDLTIRGTCSPSAPPVANAGPDQAVAEGSVATLDGSASTGANLTFGWVQLAGPSVVLNNPSSPAPTFTAPLLPGGFGSQTLTFQLTVTSGSQTSSDTVDVKVVNVNHAPVAQAGADQVVREGSQVTLSGINSFDPDGDPILYQWIQTFGTPAALSGAGSPQATFTAPLIPGGVSGTEILRFALTVSDGALSHTDEVQVTVEQENHTPVANAGDGQTVRPGVVVTLNGSGSFDPDNDPITYQWTQVGGPAVVLSNPTTATPSLTTPAVASTTQLTFRLTVSDSLLISNPADVVVTVINGPPLCGLAQATPGLLWPPNHGMREVSISGVTDPDNDGVAVAITSVTQDEPVNGLGDGDTSPDAVIMGNKVLLRAERSGKGNGRVYQVSFSANDAEGGVCTGSVKVGVPQSMKPGMSAVDDGQLHDSTLP